MVSFVCVCAHVIAKAVKGSHRFVAAVEFVNACSGTQASCTVSVWQFPKVCMDCACTGHPLYEPCVGSID